VLPRSLDRSTEWEPFGALAPCDAQIVSQGSQLDDHGGIVATYPGLCWKVDPISLDGDEGELATRPPETSRST
jgi:hypothetical protein